MSFAGVGTFLDTPVKRYSSGMFLRLGFAVAAHLEPDVLLVDEVLAVGDAAFQKKCLNAMDEMRRGGRTVVFVSHNMAAVENLCSRAVWIDAGQVRQDGKPREVIEAYLATSAEASRLERRLQTVQTAAATATYGSRSSSSLATTAGRYVPAQRRSRNPAASLRCRGPVSRPDFEIGVYTELGTLVTRFSTWIDFQISASRCGSRASDLASTTSVSCPAATTCRCG